MSIKNLTYAQKVIAAVVVSIIAYIVGTIIFALVTDKNGSAGTALTLTFLYFGLPTFLILGVLSLAYFKEEKKKGSVGKKNFASKSVSAPRVVMIISSIIAAAVVLYFLYIIWTFVSAAMSPQESEPIPQDYPVDVPSQTTN